jgi:cellulase/cellobiase CelA1
VTTTTRTPTPTATPTPSGTRTCSAALTVVNAWNAGFIGSVKVTAGSTAITRWTVTLTVPTAGSITNLWNGERTDTTVTSAAWNSGLPAAGTTDFGFQAAGPSTGWTVASCTAA